MELSRRMPYLPLRKSSLTQLDKFKRNMNVFIPNRSQTIDLLKYSSVAKPQASCWFEILCGLFSYLLAMTLDWYWVATPFLVVFFFVQDSQQQTVCTSKVLVAKSGLDYETATSHSVIVRVTDMHNLTLAQQFKVNVLDVNDQPTVCNNGEAILLCLDSYVSAWANLKTNYSKSCFRVSTC